VPIVLKSGSLNLLEPSGPLQACNGIALPLLKWKCRAESDKRYWSRVIKRPCNKYCELWMEERALSLGLYWIWHQFWHFTLVTALLSLCPQLRVSTGQSVSAVRWWPVRQCLCVSVPCRHDRSCGRRGIASFLKPSSRRFPTCYRLRNEEFIVLSVRVLWWHEQQSHDCADITTHLSS